ncbi:MAG TPA: CocE/NonD family hydrolase [Pyrinomonadaceae bacterium]|jgi:putative CocE/NonD family hydrolase|nr:CocE/NonD family hydrolase [Pyrinomonadaceae bacterium]
MFGRFLPLAFSVFLVFASAMLPATAARAQSSPQGPTTAASQSDTAAAPPYRGYTAPQYKETVLQSLYLTMRDGVKIAVDVVLPKGLAPGARIPAIVEQTRYWRARKGQTPNSYQRFFASYGYAVVWVDVRGTGASTGSWPTPWSREEIKDGGEVVDWIIHQPWSNGRVGAMGSSYGGNSALLLAVPNHPALKAIIPRHFEFDEYMDVPFPGGIFNDWMVKAWNEGNHQLDLNPGVRPVDADGDESALAEAIKAHAQNIELYSAAQQVTYRDDRPFGKSSLDDFSVHSFRNEINRSAVAINSWGGWLDAGTADAAIKSFMTLKNPQRVIVGAWNHGGSQDASPYLSSTSTGVRRQFEWLRFFDHYLKGIDTGVMPSQRTLLYYTMGEEKWKETNSWPVAGSQMVRWYMTNDQALSKSAPTAASGSDRYTVDFEATTGEKNRWRTQLGGPVVYPDRAAEDRRLLVYTSSPLTEDMEITGYPVINLRVSSTASDGAFFVYLEDVDESGRVTYITEGQLRALHRKVSKDKPPYWMETPYHSFKRKDGAPLAAGEVAELRFGLLPTSVLIRKGHSLRIAIAGHDKSTFRRIPAEGPPPVITLERNSHNASFIELPVIRRNQSKDSPVNLLTTPLGKSAATAQTAPATMKGSRCLRLVKPVPLRETAKIPAACNPSPRGL